MNETSGERVMFVKYFLESVTSETAIAWGEENGYRPAIHHETIAFVKTHPELTLNFWTAALGSFAMHGDYRHVAVLGGFDGKRFLTFLWSGSGWRNGDGFMFVRK